MALDLFYNPKDGYPAEIGFIQAKNVEFWDTSTLT